MILVLMYVQRIYLDSHNYAYPNDTPKGEF